MCPKNSKISLGEVQKIAIEVLQRNAYFAHPENIVLGMLCDEDECLRTIAVNKVQSIRRNNHHRSQIFEQQNCEASPSQENSNSTTIYIFHFLETSGTGMKKHQL